jgi:O-acetyl-ADP-ribose deacetylase (regulator of RNase III)
MANLISEQEVFGWIRGLKSRYVAFVGAGISVDSGIPSAGQICEQIKEVVVPKSLSSDTEKESWARTYLAWDDPERRYTTCLNRGLPGLPTRVEYFRGLLKWRRPTFCHMAIALLMRSGFLNSTCFTVNFDRLLENAMTELGETECMSIRSDEEVGYWNPTPERYYIVKLHGDCDTQNILNTSIETKRLSAKMRRLVADGFRHSGAFVLGCAANERSIYSLFDELTENKVVSSGILKHGLLWGVYMEGAKPPKPEDQEAALAERLKQGVVSRQMIGFMDWAQGRLDRKFGFFPVWGAANFLADLVSDPGVNLNRAAELYLDHDMRLRRVFQKAGLTTAVIDNHIKELNSKFEVLRAKKKSLAEADWIYQVDGRGLKLQVAYGDIVEQIHLDKPSENQGRRAIVSPEDTCISAGGGVARLLLEQAGTYTILNELSKLSPVEQGTVAVTSGGELPVQYIFHAAAMKIEQDPSGPKVVYRVSNDSVRSSIQACLTIATELGVQTLWMPLVGTGAGNLKADESLRSILTVIEANALGSGKGAANFNIMLYDRHVLEKDDVLKLLESVFRDGFSIKSL